MLKRRFILEQLTRQRLLEIAETFEVPGLTSYRKDQVVTALSRKRSIDPENLLQQLYRDELKDLCEAAGLDTSGRAKQVLIDRLMGREQAEPPLFTATDDNRPTSNANYAWIQHFIHHLAPTGTAGFVMANGSMSSGQSGEGEIRQRIVEADLVDCMIALPGQLFYTTGIPVCLWFLTRDKKNHRFRDRRGQTLFIDARQMGELIDRTHRELSNEEIARIARTYHAWRGEKEAGGLDAYEDTPGFCKSATLDEIKSHGHVLTPGRYVGAAEVEDDGEPFEEKMPKLVEQLKEQFAESAKLEQKIRENLKGLGYG